MPYKSRLRHQVAHVSAPARRNASSIIFRTFFLTPLTLPSRARRSLAALRGGFVSINQTVGGAEKIMHPWQVQKVGGQPEVKKKSTVKQFSTFPQNKTYTNERRTDTHAHTTYLLALLKLINIYFEVQAPVSSVESSHGTCRYVVGVFPRDRPGSPKSIEILPSRNADLRLKASSERSRLSDSSSGICFRGAGASLFVSRTRKNIAKKRCCYFMYY